MSRQDNFFLLFCKSSFYILAICVLLCWYEVSIEFFFYSCSVMVFFLFEYCLSSGGIFFSFFVLFVGGVTCIFIHLLHSSLVLFTFGVLGPWGFLWRAGSCVGLRCLECRSGTIYLSVSLGWVAGLYRFFFSGALLWWVGYD